MREAEIKNSKECIEKEIELNEKCQKISRELYESMQKDLEKENIGIIVDDTSLSIEKCDEIYGKEDNLIYCLGTAKTTAKEMIKKIRENDKEHDWTHYINDDTIELFCQNVIKQSRENRKKCQTKPNIKYWDTSEDREQVLQDIMKEIKEKNS